MAVSPPAVDELAAAARRLADAEHLARIGSWEWDIPGNRVTWSDELFRIYGLEPGAIEPSYERFIGYVHEDDRDAVDQRNRQAFADHQPFEDVKRVVRADGATILMRTRGEVVTDGDGNPIRMLGVCEDVTIEEGVRRAKAQLAAIVESSADAIYAVDPRSCVVSWNHAAEELFRVTEADAIGAPPRDPEVCKALTAVLGGGDVKRFEAQDVPGRDIDYTVSPISAVDGLVTGASVIARDVTEQRRLERQLRHLADHDALTGLSNGRHFAERLQERLAEARRHGFTGAVIVVDLDSFKEINDGHGHGAGDAVLRSVALRLRECVRATDVVARLGGDEFAMLLPHTTPDEARAIAGDILEAIRRHAVVLDGRIARITATIGVALYGRDWSGDLLAAADRAMYAGKEAGRNCVSTAAPAGAGSPRDFRARELRDALEQKRLCLHLQPILDLQRNEITRYEALVRINGPSGLILPGAFIAVAERLGLIHAIDSWVLEESIALLAAHPRLVLEVNVSGRSMGDRSLPGLIARALKYHAVDPARLVLEITETAAIANMDEALRFAADLSALGCSFALDDFGAGFGSFYYLKHLPVDLVKIDGDFVSGPRSAADDLVVQAIVQVAQGLGKRTVAEHVGDAATLDALRTWGVDFAQGYDIGRPFPASELTARSATA